MTNNTIIEFKLHHMELRIMLISEVVDNTLLSLSAYFLISYKTSFNNNFLLKNNTFTC